MEQETRNDRAKRVMVVGALFIMWGFFALILAVIALAGLAFIL